MLVTFDTNTIDKAVRPERHPKDPLRPDFDKVNTALKAGRLRGFVSDTVITLEGIQRADRAKVLGSTRLVQEHSESTTKTGDLEAETLELKVGQPARQPLHPENAARLAAALRLGFKVLSAPRIGAPRIDDPHKTVYLYEPDEVKLSARLE